MTTRDLSKFGYREKAMAAILLTELTNGNLPQDFYNDETTIMMNRNSGNVFLTNSDYQVAMMNDDKLEMFYNLPYEGAEGFIDDLLNEYKLGNITHKDDIDYLRDILKRNNYGKLPRKKKQ